MTEVFHPVSYSFRSAEDEIVSLSHEQVMAAGGAVQSFAGGSTLPGPMVLGFESAPGLVVSYSISSRTFTEDADEYSVYVDASVKCWHNYLSVYSWVYMTTGTQTSGRYVLGQWDESGAELITPRELGNPDLEFTLLPAVANRTGPFTGDFWYSTSYATLYVAEDIPDTFPSRDKYDHVLISGTAVNKYGFPGRPTMLSESHAVFESPGGGPIVIS